MTLADAEGVGTGGESPPSTYAKNDKTNTGVAYFITLDLTQTFE